MKPILPPSSNRGKYGLALATGALLALGVVLYFFPPERFSFYPKCLLFTSTGIECPSCGGLRAMHALLHGHWLEALAYNPLPMGVMLWATGYGMSCLARPWTKRNWPGLFLNPFWIGVLILFALILTLARNLPLRFPIGT